MAQPDGRVNPPASNGTAIAFRSPVADFKPEVLKRVKVGDTIMATVYKGETTLHDVMVMPPGKQDKKSSK